MAICSSRPGTSLFIDENLEQKVVGIFSVVWPPAVQQVVYRIREHRKIWDEIKWTTTSKLKVPFYFDLIENFFQNTNWGRVNIVPITTTIDNAIKHGLRKIKAHCMPFNGIFIDNHTTPKGYSFERDLKDEFLCNCIMRLDSKSTDLLQLCDLLMNLEVKSTAPHIVTSPPKREILEKFIYVKELQRYPKIFMI